MSGEKPDTGRARVRVRACDEEEEEEGSAPGSCATSSRTHFFFFPLHPPPWDLATLQEPVLVSASHTWSSSFGYQRLW